MTLNLRFFILFTAFSILTLSAQKKEASLDFGLFLGATNYMGDFTKGSMPVMGETKPAGGLVARYNYGPYLTFKGTALYGRIQGGDYNFSDDVGRRRRNLSFRSDIVEFSVQGEWNIRGYENTRTSYAWTPFLFGGVSVFRFNPKAQFNYVDGLHDPSLRVQNGDWVELQPLGTEGQETTKFNDKRRYTLTQVSIPFGVGAKWQLDDNWALGFEFGLRKTFTDYLDDVSTIYVDDLYVLGASGPLALAMKDRSLEVNQMKFENNEARGGAGGKDWYMMTGLTITYRILGGSQPCFNF
jgi:hypothetical protein